MLVASACGTQTTRTWREQRLASGRTIKVTSFNLTWGVEHDERPPANDALALEYVWSAADLDVKRREAEAVEAFELIRPICEQWGFRTASLAGFPALTRKGAYDLYRFERGAAGTWSFTRSDAKVFATD